MHTFVHIYIYMCVCVFMALASPPNIAIAEAQKPPNAPIPGHRKRGSDVMIGLCENGGSLYLEKPVRNA